MLPESIKSVISQCQKILIIWNNVQSDYLKQLSDEIKSIGKTDMKLNFEHFQQLTLKNFPKSSFDAIIVGFPNGLSVNQSIDDIQNFFFDTIDYLRQNGSIFYFESRESRGTIEKVMKLSGLIDINGAEIDQSVAMYSARSPPFELGALTRLSLDTAGDHRQGQQARVWRLEGDDLIDTDALLEPDDLTRPSIGAANGGANGASGGCGTKRACKNCTCGLADSVDTSGNDRAAAPVQSACGNCYLGDGFRCSGCPYLGMPPFKPGERVLLVDSDDIDI